MISVDMFGFWLDLVPDFLFVISFQRFIIMRKFLMSVVIWVWFTLHETVFFLKYFSFVGCFECVPDSFELVRTHGTGVGRRGLIGEWRNPVTREKLPWL